MSLSFDVSVVQGAVSNLIFLATNAIPPAMGHEGDRRKIIQSLTTIQAMLRDAHNRITESESPGLAWWVSFTNSKIWRVENMLDEISYEALRFTVETQNHTTNKELTISSTHISSDRIGSMHHPSLAIFSSDWNSERIGGLLTDVFENSSEFLLLKNVPETEMRVCKLKLFPLQFFHEDES
ncbi:hypothetical protein Vadar_022417 [Vaccinium darrowii]|uniref:Uncharacterized protein n=1 Tax=Vaccinium darrowii TaxID=229202 RepID=A0ACB7YGI4_9ERIC|nr:hypothetical protein Vadar_022417 [Vaccinium darrowii]